MGFINLLKNGYRGKLGETVGQKWKNQLTIRTYQAENNSKSEAQLDQRAHYKEMIAQASAAYSSRANFPKSPSKKMNEFNYYTSLLEKIGKEGVPFTKFLFTGIFRRSDICHPSRVSFNGAYYFFTPVPPDVTQVNLKDYKLVIIYNFNELRGRYQEINITFNQITADRQFKTGENKYPGGRGIMWRIATFPTYRGALYGAWARRKNGKWEYSGIFNLRDTVSYVADDFEATQPPITIIQ